MCGTVWCGFVGVSVCCVWGTLVWVCGSECVLFFIEHAPLLIVILHAVFTIQCDNKKCRIGFFFTRQVLCMSIRKTKYQIVVYSLKH